MKKLLLLTLGLTLTTLGAQASDNNTVTIGVRKASDNTATVTEWSGKKAVTVVPVTFASDATWGTLKDSYEVSPETAAGLESKKLGLMVNSDSGLSYPKLAPEKKAKHSSKKSK